MIFKKFFNQNEGSAEFFANKFNISPLLSRLILSRGIDTEEKMEEFLHPKTFYDPFLLKGMKELKDRIYIAKEMKDKVLIFGDYDVDGVSATAIMLKTLKKLGISADFYLPNRFVDGYGLTSEVIDKIIKDYSPDLIITVDCGISCYKEVEYAKNKGLEIIVTDHHEIPEIIPDGIVLNAKMKGQEYPFKDLCGTGLAFKISQALLGQKGAEEFLPIAALATVADIVPLLDENRCIVTKGLSLCDKLPAGVKMLIKELKLTISKLSSNDISYKLAPKLNASGRMGDARDSLMLYLETDPVKLREYIEKIKIHNQRRQELCAKIYDQALRALKNVDLKERRVISLASKSWDQGVLGIVCSRLVEKFHKPVFLFSQVGDVLHGSGRSIDDINIHELLSSLKDILETYGGHSMAAGLTLKRHNYEEFSERINAFVVEKVADEVFIPISYYDEVIESGDLTDEVIKELSLLEPLGCQNPRPRFKISANDLTIEPMKKFPQHAVIKIDDLELVYFNYLQSYTKIKFSKQKSFIFELQGEEKRGLVCEFDGGSYIDEESAKITNSIEALQLGYKNEGQKKINYYKKEELLSLVTSTHHSVFGTVFVAFSAEDYTNFAKTYTLQGIYNFGICDRLLQGYNSLILSPLSTSFAKNYNKVIFLSPVLNEGYLQKIAADSSAEIFVPVYKKYDFKKLAGFDLSRETYALVFKNLVPRRNGQFANIFALYEDCFKKGEVSFKDFFVAICVFMELGLINLQHGEFLSLFVCLNKKKNLTESKIYQKLNIIKQSNLGE